MWELHKRLIKSFLKKRGKKTLKTQVLHLASFETKTCRWRLNLIKSDHQPRTDVSLHLLLQLFFMALDSLATRSHPFHESQTRILYKD